MVRVLPTAAAVLEYPGLVLFTLGCLLVVERHHPEGHRETKRGSFPGHALEKHVPAVQPHDLSGEGQAQPRPAPFLRVAGTYERERDPDFLLVFGRDADAFVDDEESDLWVGG
jgi:hypothetical protein